VKLGETGSEFLIFRVFILKQIKDTEFRDINLIRYQFL